MPRQQVRITRASVFRYHMPLKRAYGTARGVVRTGINFVVHLTAAAGSQHIEGVGECQPRHALTGDGGKDRVAAWVFACDAMRHLQDRELRFDGPDEAVSAIRELMAELDNLARHHADERNRQRPFRGTLLGIEVALLD